jgi:hypothetical protein
MKTLLLSLFLMTSAHAERTMNIIPGKSIGDLNIGATSVELAPLGYTLDKWRSSIDPSVTYYKKGSTLVRLKNDRVVQVWPEYSSYKRLLINGKRLPKKLGLKDLKKSLQNCEQHKGSGGPVGISVIQPSEVAGIVGK